MPLQPGDIMGPPLPLPPVPPTLTLQVTSDDVRDDNDESYPGSCDQ